MNNFYLTLLSDSSLSTFSKNTQCDFKVKLDHSIQIEKDNWEVGLVEVITPTEVNNITKENNYVILRLRGKICIEYSDVTNYNCNRRGLLKIKGNPAFKQVNKQGCW